jgi:methylated-DNA-[protein]-cysteine S-methyltransferase
MVFTFLPFEKGKLLLVKDEQGLVLAEYVESTVGTQKADGALEALLKQGWTLHSNDAVFDEERRCFGRYFDGRREDFGSIPIHPLFGTSYQQRVWEAARKIPYGRVASYKDIALQLHSHGYRSVGQALNRNPLIILIPCHRVISADGGIGGFGAGLALKRYLLELENQNIRFSD